MSLFLIHIYVNFHEFVFQLGQTSSCLFLFPFPGGIILFWGLIKSLQNMVFMWSNFPVIWTTNLFSSFYTGVIILLEVSPCLWHTSASLFPAFLGRLLFVGLWTQMAWWYSGKGVDLQSDSLAFSDSLLYTSSTIDPWPPSNHRGPYSAWMTHTNSLSTVSFCHHFPSPLPGKPCYPFLPFLGFKECYILPCLKDPTPGFSMQVPIT